MILIITSIVLRLVLVAYRLYIYDIGDIDHATDTVTFIVNE